MHILDDAQNPINTVEEILTAQGWDFERLNEDEILLEVSGDNGNYDLQFTWQESVSALQMSIKTDIQYSQYQYSDAASVISAINSKMWLGHFEISQDQLCPTFRYACFMRGMTSFNGADYLADIMEVALLSCEKHYAQLYAVLEKEDDASSHVFGEENYNLAYLATAGNA